MTMNFLNYPSLLSKIRSISSLRSLSSLVSFSDRTHTCGELRSEHVGQKVKIAGWVQYSRVDRFFLIRDAFGITQVTLKDLDHSLKINLESCIKVEGIVQKRPEGQENPKLATGSIEVVVDEIQDIYGSSDHAVPVLIKDSDKIKEDTLSKYRYLALRNPKLQSNLRLRSSMIMKIRQFLTDQGFVDVDTPCLFRKTPGGAQEFVVPTKKPGHFYSLTQSPQQFKQLLMVGGMDRYFQIAKCFRDEGSKKDRQPEFTQVDIELSFTNRNHIINLIEALVKYSWPSHLPDLNQPFQRLSYEEVMNKYGIDKPDLRFSNQIVELTDCFKEVEFLQKFLNDGYVVKGISFVPEKDISVKTLKDIEANIKKYLNENHAKSRPFILSHFMNSKNSPAMGSSVLKKCSNDVCDKIKHSLSVEDNSVGFLICAPSELAINGLGKIRNDLAAQCLNFDPNDFSFLWVEDFPLFLEGDEGIESAHHPFTRPCSDDIHLLDNEPLKVHGEHYDLVLNGQEIAGGSIRIHEADLQEKVIRFILKEDMTGDLDHLVEALRNGCPPHGGIAIGLDRYLAILTKSNSIRDVIAFPKSSDGRDPMSNAPALISDDDKQRYHIKIIDKQ